jgi:hypothetical protein
MKIKNPGDIRHICDIYFIFSAKVNKKRICKIKSYLVSPFYIRFWYLYFSYWYVLILLAVFAFIYKDELIKGDESKVNSLKISDDSADEKIKKVSELNGEESEFDAKTNEDNIDEVYITKKTVTEEN